MNRGEGSLGEICELVVSHRDVPDELQEGGRPVIPAIDKVATITDEARAGRLTGYVADVATALLTIDYQARENESTIARAIFGDEFGR